ncbi:hypothetical protein GCM10027089_10150 [Nocardia thraciensis]
MFGWVGGQGCGLLHRVCLAVWDAGSVNRLASATSPYLRQHADNPVDWREWDAEALAEAAARDVPILLSIGYASCHWCQLSY